MMMLSYCLGNAQQISQKNIKLTHSKEASKASKAGSLWNAGIYWNEDQTVLYKIAAFKEKKTKQDKIEVMSFKQSGEFIKTEVMDMTEANLAKYKLTDFNGSTATAREELSGFKAAFISNPTLAGKPSLIYGEFVEKYNDLGIFERYKFKKGDKKKIEDTFWSTVYYPLESSIIERNNYLIQPKSKLGKAIFNARNAYMPTTSKAYVGGLMATVGSKKFLSGILDVNTATWVTKHEIEFDASILPGDLNYMRLDNQATAILVPTVNHFYYLQVEKTGAKEQLTKLSIPRSGGKHNLAPSTLLYKEASAVLALAATYETIGGKAIGLGISKLEAGKEAWTQHFSNEALMAKLVQPNKQKVKLNKISFFALEKIRKLKNGDYLVLGNATKATANGTEKVFLAIQLSNEGALKACYLMEAIDTPKNQTLGESLPVQLIETNDGNLYLIQRAEVEGYGKGVYYNVERSKMFTTRTSYRIDHTFSAGFVLKLDISSQKISNIIQLDELIVGDHPGTLSKDGHLLLEVQNQLVVIQ